MREPTLQRCITIGYRERARDDASASPESRVSSSSSPRISRLFIFSPRISRLFIFSPRISPSRGVRPG